MQIENRPALRGTASIHVSARREASRPACTREAFSRSPLPTFPSRCPARLPRTRSLASSARPRAPLWASASTWFRACVPAWTTVSNTCVTSFTRPGDRRIRADRVAATARGAVFGDPLWMLKSNAAHVPEQGGDCRHRSQANERIGDDVGSHPASVKAACLFPEPMNVGAGRLTLRSCFQQDRKCRRPRRCRSRLTAWVTEPCGTGLTSSKPRLTTDMFSSTMLRTLAPKLVLELAVNRLEQTLMR